MLSDKNSALLRTLETKYVTLLDVAKDIAWISMGNSQLEVELERLIIDQQHEIHEKAEHLFKGDI